MVNMPWTNTDPWYLAATAACIEKGGDWLHMLDHTVCRPLQTMKEAMGAQR